MKKRLATARLCVHNTEPDLGCSLRRWAETSRAGPSRISSSPLLLLNQSIPRSNQNKLRWSLDRFAIGVIPILLLNVRFTSKQNYYYVLSDAYHGHLIQLSYREISCPYQVPQRKISMSDNQGYSSSYELIATQPDVQCLVCTRPFTLDTEVIDSFEALEICRECKMTVLSDNNRDETATASTNRQRIQRRRRSRAARHEPIQDIFSQQFSQLINLARQGHEADVDSPPVPRHQASYSSTPNRSQRWHTSDDESDGLSYADSMFGEIESNISFGDDGGESDASLEHRTTLGREIVIQLDRESYMNTDTDIDPMNAGISHWDSDDSEDEQSEESDLDEAADTMQERRQHWHGIAPSGLNEQESEDTVWTWRTDGSQGVSRTNLRADTEGREIRRLFIANPGDYVDARQFEMLLEQFAEDNNTTRGAPPAATSSVENLPSVVISTCNEINGGVTCLVCKDDMPIKTIAKQLPCMHLYHSSCILPWLSSRNTCPVCRYELPTDDTEYKRSKRATVNEEGIHGVERTHPQETVEETSHEPEVEGSSDTVGVTI